MDTAKGNLVLATAGREKGKPFFVLDEREGLLLLADGKARKLEAPKKKKPRHVSLLSADCGAVAGKIRSNETITNSELRKAIAVYRGEHGNQDQEG